MDKIAADLEDVARRNNSKMLYWHVNKFSSQSRLFPVKDRNGPHLVISTELKRDGHFRLYYVEVELQEKIKMKIKRFVI